MIARLTETNARDHFKKIEFATGEYERAGLSASKSRAYTSAVFGLGRFIRETPPALRVLVI
jgi:hypothetical protein